MKRLILIAALAAAAPAAAMAGDLTGAWTLKGSVPQYGFDFTLNCDLKQDGETLGGTCKDQQGGTMATTGKVADKAVSFDYDANLGGQVIHVTYKGDVQDDGTLKGTLQGGDATGTFTASK